MPATPLRVLIIGCGNMAGGFDAARAADAPPLTHAGAFLQHGKFALIACVDPDDEKRAAFSRRWNVEESYTEISQLGSRRGEFDVISICSPTVFHPEHLQAAVELRPALIFCEKPITPDLEQTEAWVARCEAAGIALAINHTRRWAPDVNRVAEELCSGAWGEIRSVVGHYNKGILNNGSHMVDLLHLLIGPLELIQAGEPIWDCWEKDPSIPAMLRGPGNVPVYLNVAHAADYAYFELQVVTRHGVIAMEDGGLQWRIRRTEDSPHFKGYRSLGSGQRHAGEYALAMEAAVANIYNALTGNEPLASTGHSALAAQRICEQILLSATGQVSHHDPSTIHQD